MKILVTGAAGFIGMHTCLRLLARGDQVIGVDNLNDYYDVSLKYKRLQYLKKNNKFSFHQIGVEDNEAVGCLFKKDKPSKVIHLAAQAGVRHSLTNPNAYIDSNLSGFMNILEGCRHTKVDHLVYASSSSVYGGNSKMPFSEHHSVDHPISLYAATKKSNELMAHAYSHLFNIPTTGLRFFTVYGPWGRPDMALFMFTKAIIEGKPIQIFNNGQMERDFTYIDDIVEGIIRVLDKNSSPNLDNNPGTNPYSDTAPYRIFNIGNGKPTQLMTFIKSIELALGKEAKKSFLPMQPGDVPRTFSDTSELARWINFKPNTPVTRGVENFVNWYKSIYC